MRVSGLDVKIGKGREKRRRIGKEEGRPIGCRRTTDVRVGETVTAVTAVEVASGGS
jgi:hypothetical protein